MTGSRFIKEQPLTLKRLQDFVALDSITAQMPLIETNRDGKRVRIWVAYDVTRTLGTYVEIDTYGCVRTITVYPSGRTNEVINKPAYRVDRRVRKAKGLHLAVPKSKRFKAVSKRSRYADTEE
jgi:hypothetical protein